MIDALFYILDKLIDILPTLNLLLYIDEMPIDLKNVLPYVNYFIPVADIVYIMKRWLTCIKLYYTYLNVRWALENHFDKLKSLKE